MSSFIMEMCGMCRFNLLQSFKTRIGLGGFRAPFIETFKWSEPIIV